MQFGYFTLSDNHYDSNPRTANQFIGNVLDQACLRGRVGLHSAWIGEHHFSTPAVLSCLDLVPVQVATLTAPPPKKWCSCARHREAGRPRHDRR
jgi:alkanesulfonate monooxygenase SsuD/methylene tetrahydromethanopterin reductase-like flavin-dependent oxidoreductase (luciferase family)